MSDILKGLRTYLAASTTVTSLTSTRIYYGNLPQDPTLPAIAVNLIDSEDVRHLTAASGLARSLIQVDCHADSHGSAYNVGDAVRLLTEHYTGAMGSETCRSCYTTSMRDLSELPEGGEQLYGHIRSLDLTLYHTQTAP